MKRVLLVAVLLPLLVACTLPHPRPPDDPPTSPAASQLVIDLGGGVWIAVLGTDSSWAPTAEHNCADAVHRLVTPTGDYQVALLRADCTGAPQALNGFHGYFVSPPAGSEVATATTPLGPARLFSHQYEECTNSCGFGTDEVALVAVGDRTIQAIAVAGVSGAARTRDRAQLVSLLQGLRKA